MGKSYPDRTNATGIWKLKDITRNKITDGTYPQQGAPGRGFAAGGNGSPLPAYAGPLFPTMPTDWKTATGPTGLYAGGEGGGGDNAPQGARPPGGGGQGGTGGCSGGNESATAAIANMGGGGGGATGCGGSGAAAGGDGIVICRYQS